MTLPLNYSTIILASALRAIASRYRFRGLERFIRLFFHPDKMSGEKFHVKFDELIYEGRTDSFIDWNILFYGSYEESDLLLLGSIAQRIAAPTALDVGANVGQHSLYLSQFCEKVFSFEPNNDLTERFHKNLVNNKIGNVFLFSVALGNENEKLKLFKSTESAENSLLKDYGRLDENRFLEVDVYKGDYFLKHENISSKIDIIKIDVEGFEYNVLRGLKETLEKNRPIILTELTYASHQLFGSADNFISSFPNDYCFFSRSHPRGFFLTQSLEPLHFKIFKEILGNIYCIPNEKLALFKDALANCPSRISHTEPRNRITI